MNHVEPLCAAIFQTTTLLAVEKKKSTVHGKIYNGALNTKYRRVPVDFALSKFLDLFASHLIRKHIADLETSLARELVQHQ